MYICNDDDDDDKWDHQFERVGHGLNGKEQMGRDVFKF